MVDILNIEPTKVSRDLQGKFILIYSQPKMGKTTFAVQMPKNLLLAFEHGYNALGGIKAVDIDKWATFKQIIRQLRQPEAKEMYKTITIDTAGIAYTLCEEYICNQQNVSKIGDIPYGAGYGIVEKEFQDCLRQITQMGYGLVLISHSVPRIEKTDDDGEIEIISPDLPKRGYKVINQLVDIICYIDIIWDKDGNSKRVLYTRKTPQIMAGSRFKYLSPIIPFGYDELTKAIAEAIEKEANENGSTLVDHQETTNNEERTFEDIREEARSIWTHLLEVNKENIKKLNKIILDTFGRPIKLSEITENQKDLFEVVLAEMKEL